MPTILDLTTSVSPSGDDYFVVSNSGGPYTKKIAYSNLGIGSVTGVVDVTKGGTGATSASNARTNLSASVNVRSLTVDIDGDGAVINTGILSQSHVIGYDATINGYTFVSSLAITGDISVDILKSNYSSFPTFTSITSGNYANISGAIKNTSSSLTGWTTSISAGDIFKAEVKSCNTIQLAKLVLDLRG